MKKYFFILLSILITGCSDGDLQIEALEFDNIAVQNCGTLNTDTQLFFKINEEETLILQLQSNLLQNEVSTATITSTIPGQSQLTYRLFDGNLTSNYFCDSIPPVTPNNIEEIEATSGTVLISTATTDSITFNHTISFQDIILVNSLDESIIDLSTTNFGQIQTTAN